MLDSSECITRDFSINKIEHLKIKTKMNHFALKSTLYLKAVRSAFNLQQLQAA